MPAFQNTFCSSILTTWSIGYTHMPMQSYTFCRLHTYALPLLYIKSTQATGFIPGQTGPELYGIYEPVQLNRMLNDTKCDTWSKIVQRRHT